MITLQPLPNFSVLEIKFCEPRMSVGHRKGVIVLKKRSFLKRTGREHIVVGAPVIDDNGPDRRFVRTSRIKAVHSRIVGIDRITSAQLIFFRRNRLSAHPPRESCPLSSPECSCLTRCTEVQRRGAPGKGTWNRPEAVADVFGVQKRFTRASFDFSPNITLEHLPTVIADNLTLTVIWHLNDI